MTFEEAMREELIQIPNLNQKVFPLIAPEGTKVPFVVYKKERVDFGKTLSGMSEKAEGNYTLSVLESDYSRLQQLTDEIKNKFMSFFGRPIGSSGPVIQNVTVTYTGDQYEPTVNLMLANISIKVNY